MLEIEQDIIEILEANRFVVKEFAEPFVIEIIADDLTSNHFAFTLKE